MEVLKMVRTIRIDFKNPWVIIGIVAAGLLCVNGLAALTESKPQGMDAVRRTITYDTKVFWHPKSRASFDVDGIRLTLNAAGLRDERIRGRRVDTEYRVLSFGSTDTFGWGVTAQCTYPELLEQQLQAVFGDRKQVHVINAGIAGYSTWQGKQIFERYLDRYRPQLITIAYGMSDVDVFRYYCNDGAPDSVVRTTPVHESLLTGFALGRMFGRMFDAHMSVVDKQLGPAYVQYTSERRVPVSEYESHLHYMCAIAAARKIPVVLVKMPWSSTGYAPVLPGKQQVAHLHVVQAQLLMQLRRYTEALHKLSEATVSDPFSREAAFYAAVCYERLGNKKKALSYVKQFVMLEAYESARLRPLYARIMEAVARTNHVLFADTMKAFGRERKDGTQLFLGGEGPVQFPNAKGHAAIAREIFDALLKNDMLSAEKIAGK